MEHLKPADSSYGLNVRLLSYFKIAVYYVYNILLAAVDILCMYSFLINNSYTMYILLLVIMLVAMPLANLIPMQTHAGILLVERWNMCEFKEFAEISHTTKSDISVLILTFILTVVLL